MDNNIQNLDEAGSLLYNQLSACVGAIMQEALSKIMAPKVIRQSLYDDSGIWRMRVTVEEPATKKQTTKTKTTGLRVRDHTKRKAQTMLTQYVADIENGVIDVNQPNKLRTEDPADSQPVNDEPDSPPFSEYVERFITKKENTRRANTAKSYRDYARVHILPSLGDIPITSLKLSDLQEYYDSKLQILSVGSVKKQHVVISGAVMEAVRDGIIPTNFADYVEFPPEQKFHGKAYDEDKLASLMSAAQDEGEPIYSAVILASVYALRRSEIVGLRWCDIDFSNGYMHICNTVTQNGALRIEGEQTKTKASNRVIPLIGETVDYLKGLRETHREAGILTEDLKCKVCRWPNGKDVRPDFLTKKLRTLMKEHGLDQIRLHDLRHTAATLLARHATPKQVQNFLGHEDVSTTLNIYTHLVDEDKIQTSNIMDGIMSGIIPTARREA